MPDDLDTELFQHIFPNDKPGDAFKIFCTTEHEFSANLAPHILAQDLTILHINTRSLNANIDNLRQLLASLHCTFDIIVLSEIWNYNLPFYKNAIAGYKLEYATPKNSRIGGVGIFIKSGIVSF